jgi:ABC-type enterochelin transport system permease subunit
MDFKIIYLIVAIISFFAYTFNIINTCVSYSDGNIKLFRKNLVWTLITGSIMILYFILAHNEHCS